MEKRFAYRMRATVVHEPEFYTWGGYKHANIKSNNKYYYVYDSMSYELGFRCLFLLFAY